MVRHARLGLAERGGGWRNIGATASGQHQHRQKGKDRAHHLCRIAWLRNLVNRGGDSPPPACDRNRSTPVMLPLVASRPSG
jgi:hypothetical protein